ncbi:MAG TPA: alpha/beta fold hydrolase [Actinokineospora sp.]|nr:alpha/beta fold hydrolase [Actinokineospora sp.]
MPVLYRRPGQVCVEHTIEVPLDHDDPAGPTIELFAREVARPDGADLPLLLFLQGGPGYAATWPSSSAAWLGQALKEFRVVLLDPRGTGRSTPANRQSLRGTADPAAYLSRFRADSIVRDAELVRARLGGGKPWSVLGQSYGGFCALTYLSLVPEGLREVMIGGGLPALDGGPDPIYRAAFPRAIEATERFYARYPGDRAIARRVADHLAETDVRLPGGDRLTPERFQLLGLALGTSGTEDLPHHLLEVAFTGGELSDVFLRGVDTAVSMATRPLYALLHESIYCQDAASAWSAHRVRGEFDKFDTAGGGDVLFTAEMIEPWLFEQDPALAPLRDSAQRLAEHRWSTLYDPARLAANDVPVAAAVYLDDLYVDAAASLRTAEQVRGLRVWATADHAHNGLSADPTVFDRLLGMVRGEV